MKTIMRAYFSVTKHNVANQNNFVKVNNLTYKMSLISAQNYFGSNLIKFLKFLQESSL